MYLRRFLANSHHCILSALRRRDFLLADCGPVISFTFDDFPLSALTVGGAILKSYDMCGTYYAAMGLVGKTSAEIGPYFGSGDLESLLMDGHELGSHTFSHLSCRGTSPSDFMSDAMKGKAAVECLVGQAPAHHFSYPYGHATWRTKAVVGAAMATCRGIFPGINASPVDLNLLRANRLYSWSFDLHAIGSLVNENSRKRGWLIFYTHDISDHPSLFGCTAAQFESLVRITKRYETAVLTLGQAAGMRSKVSLDQMRA